MLVENISKGKLIAENVRRAAGFWERARGLLFSAPLKEGCGLWIEPCNSVHTFFMGYDIDVIFLSPDYKIVYIIENMKPWRISKIVRKAKAVLELRAGTVNKFSIQIGDQLKLSM